MAILEQRQDPVVGQAGVVGEVVAPSVELVAIEPVEPVLGGDPDEAVAVLQHVVDVLLRQAGVERQPVEADVQAVRRARRAGQKQQPEAERDGRRGKSMALP